MARTPKPSGSKRPSFETELCRRTGGRTQRDRLLVVCGAKVTEKDYLQGLKQAERNPAVSVKLVEHPRSPSQVVAYAAGIRRQAPEDYDQVWCVLDVDEFPDVAAAVAEAARQDIAVALSNPCFELWLLLHFADHRAFVRTFGELVPRLKDFVPRYDKSRIDFRHFRGGWRDAVRRAQRLAREGTEQDTNPSTGVWRLALAIGRSE